MPRPVMFNRQTMSHTWSELDFTLRLGLNRSNLFSTLADNCTTTTQQTALVSTSSPVTVCGTQSMYTSQNWLHNNDKQVGTVCSQRIKTVTLWHVASYPTNGKSAVSPVTAYFHRLSNYKQTHSTCYLLKPTIRSGTLMISACWIPLVKTVLMNRGPSMTALVNSATVLALQQHYNTRHLAQFTTTHVT